MQTQLTKSGIIKDELEILRNTRQILYNDLVIRLNMLNSNKKDLIKNYNKEVKNIDFEINSKILLNQRIKYKGGKNRK